MMVLVVIGLSGGLGKSLKGGEIVIRIVFLVSEQRGGKFRPLK